MEKKRDNELGMKNKSDRRERFIKKNRYYEKGSIDHQEEEKKLGGR